MKQTTTAVNYNFDKSYYENFLSNRLAGITGSGNVNVALKKLFMEYMVIQEIDNGEELVDCVGHIDIKSYVKRVYNGDKPMCLDQKFKKATEDMGAAISTWDNTVVDMFNVIGGGKKCFKVLGAKVCR